MPLNERSLTPVVTGSTRNSGGGRQITTWKQFARNVRKGNCKLLNRLDEFPNSVLVAGCQRSGTTMLTNIVVDSDGMVNYRFGEDSELDGALILAGQVEHQFDGGRYCFQTTYLNECYPEYLEHVRGHHTIIWVLRNPFSVVYSLLHNWGRFMDGFALNELFRGCGVDLLSGTDRRRYELLGLWGVSRLLRACSSYNGKLMQIFELAKGVWPNHLMIVDYDELTQKKKDILPKIYEHIDMPYREEYCHRIHGASLSKGRSLSRRERAAVTRLCVPTYERARALVNV